jgi:hypothetical protein
MIRLALAKPGTAVLSFDRCCATPVLPVAIGRQCSPPRRLLPREAINAPRQQAANVQIPIASDAQASSHLPRFPCMGLFLSRSSPEQQIFCPSSVSLFDLKARFFVPTRGSLTSSRAGAVKVGRRANVAACSELARPYLDSFEHDGTLGAIGMTIRGEPAFGRGSVAPQPCIRWVQGPEP